MTDDLRPRRYPTLFSPLALGKRTARNRIMVPAHSTNLGEQGRPTPRQAAYYRARAAGGAGSIVIGGVRVHPTSVSSGRALRSWDPAALPEFRMLAGEIQAEGALVIAQLLHVGKEVTTQESGRSLWSASAIASPMQREMPHAMTRGEIGELLDYYRRGAEVMAGAGFDGLEIHAAHGYLIQQFLSPLTNHRADEYGGSLDNRLRFARQVIAAVRSGAGDLVVGLRISGDEFTDGGLDIEAMCQLAPLLAADIDYLSVSHCTYQPASFITMIPDMHQPRAAYVYLAERIKAVVPPQLPVVTVGRITTAAEAESILQRGGADLVAMARATIADPQLPNKSLAGREDTIIPCISCNQGCVGMVHALRPILCLQNPVTGREASLGERITPSESPRRVLVIGGGIAGMEAAIVARQRGHDVTIWEDTAGLGGMARWASVPLGREDFKGTYTFRKAEVRRHAIPVRFGKRATAAAVRDFAPDVVILATGARPAPAAFPGADPHQILTIEAMIIEAIEPGERVLYVDDDGHHRGAGSAESLARTGHRVSVVTSLAAVGADIIPMSGIGVALRLRDRGVDLHPNSRITRVDGRRVTITDWATGGTTVFDGIDRIVVAGARIANDELLAELDGVVPEIHAVGDALAPRRALDAIRDGHLVARSL